MDNFFNIPHPTNRVWPGTPNDVMCSIEEAYKDGVISGTQWPEHKDWEYVPGGPWVHRYDEPRFIALCAHSKAVHKAWMRGWHKGFTEFRLIKVPNWYRPERY